MTICCVCGILFVQILRFGRMGNESSTPSSSSRNQRASSQVTTSQSRPPPPPPQQQQQQQLQSQPQRRESLPAPGAYKMPGQPTNNGQRFYVTIPRGVQPGQVQLTTISMRRTVGN